MKLQAARGTAEAALINTDVVEVETGASISVDPRMKEVDLVGSPQNASIIGPREVAVSMNFPLRTAATEGGQGQIEKALLSGFMGVAESDTDSDSTSDRFIYTPSLLDSAWRDYTVWEYSGCSVSNLSLCTKVQNFMAGLKFVLDFDNGYASIQLSGKAVLVSTPALATQPTITPSTVLTPALIGATVSFLGDSDYIPISLEFDLGPEVTATLNPGATNGSGLGVCAPGSKRKIKWTAKVYHDSGVIPHTALLAGTTGTISVAWGTTPNKFTISTTKAQITSVKQSEQGNVSCFDLSGICVDNDFAFQIDTAVAS